MRARTTKLGTAEVDVAARRQDSPPKFVEISYGMRITTSEPQRRIDVIHLKLHKYGTVYNTIAAVCCTPDWSWKPQSPNQLSCREHSTTISLDRK